MDDPKPGPSGTKRPKITFRNLNKLTEEELEYLLYNSETEIDDNDDRDFDVASKNSEESESEDETGK